MDFSTLKTLIPTATPLFSSFTRLSKFPNSNATPIRLKPKKEKDGKSFFISLKCNHSSDSNVDLLKSNTRSPNIALSCSAITETAARTLSVADRLHCLASEFKFLSEPIDRVKRLLHYATLLPPFDELSQVQSNRVMGCTAQVWLEVKMEANGLMRFRVDSDSEITKGFCSCLIWLLDGAAPEEVLMVKTDDLGDMNIGLHGRAHSRVNTWHNVLINIQKRTKALVAERDEQPLLEPFPSLVVAADDPRADGSYIEAQVCSNFTRSLCFLL